MDPMAADAYALGVTLWQLWFKHAPFEGVPADRLRAHVARGRRVPFAEPAAGEPHCPAPLRGLIERLWADDPAARPTAAAALAAFDAEVAPALLLLASAHVADARGAAAAGAAGAASSGGDSFEVAIIAAARLGLDRRPFSDSGASL